jgi:hypothetical protein
MEAIQKKGGMSMDEKDVSVYDYLIQKYHPSTFILYGSFADSTNVPGSDFDCLLVVPKKEKSRDISLINGIRLDVWIITEDEVKTLTPQNYALLYKGLNILGDEAGLYMLEKANQVVDKFSHLSDDEREVTVYFIKKLLNLAGKNDVYGKTAYHELISKSLYFYIRLKSQCFFGAKKTLKYLKEKDAKGFALYNDVLNNNSIDSLKKWVDYLIGEDKKDVQENNAGGNQL